MALDPVIQVGSKLKDNDPRMKGRILTVTKLLPNGVEAKDSIGRVRMYLAHRIHVDNRERRSGLNLLYHLTA